MIIKILWEQIFSHNIKESKFKVLEITISEYPSCLFT